jgi:hypothetical protein
MRDGLCLSSAMVKTRSLYNAVNTLCLDNNFQPVIPIPCLFLLSTEPPLIGFYTRDGLCLSSAMVKIRSLYNAVNTLCLNHFQPVIPDPLFVSALHTPTPDRNLYERWSLFIFCPGEDHSHVSTIS